MSIKFVLYSHKTAEEGEIIEHLHSETVPSIGAKITFPLLQKHRGPYEVFDQVWAISSYHPDVLHQLVSVELKLVKYGPRIDNFV